MNFKLSIDCDNDAFEDCNTELSRILRELADKLDNGVTQAILRDYNGNTVGQAEFILTEAEQCAQSAKWDLSEPSYVE
jgi:hypothetical protein